jgi:hypothetical protein
LWSRSDRTVVTFTRCATVVGWGRYVIVAGTYIEELGRDRRWIERSTIGAWFFTTGRFFAARSIFTTWAIVARLAGGTETFALPSLGWNGFRLLGREDVQLDLLFRFRSGDGRSWSGDGGGVFFDGGNRRNVSGGRGSDNRGGF